MAIIDGACDLPASLVGYPWTPVLLTKFTPVQPGDDPNYWQPLWGGRYENFPECPGAYPWNLGNYPFVFDVPPMTDGDPEVDGATLIFCGSHEGIGPPGVPESALARKLNVQTERWSAPVAAPTEFRPASCAMFRKDRILRGGDDLAVCPSPPPAASHRAQLLRLDQSWQTLGWDELPAMPTVDPLAIPDDASREHRNITFVSLPSGQILSIGGRGPHTGVDPENPADDFPGARPDLFDPFDLTQSQYGSWREMAPMVVDREYHSTPILLLDGSVLTAGGEGLQCGEYKESWDTYCIYKPPYFFQGTRPTITALSDADPIIYGRRFQVTTPNANAVTAVRLLRTGAVTHGFDQNARMLDLTFTVLDSNTLCVAAPASGHEGPPGWWMLFIATEANGSLPSVGKFVRLGMPSAPPQ